jgi:hypothetical protein
MPWSTRAATIFVIPGAVDAITKEPTVAVSTNEIHRANLAPKPRGNVMIVPGVLGSALYEGSFVSTYQILPFAAKRKREAEKLLEPGTYGRLEPPPDRFETARQFQAQISGTLCPDKTTYIAGYGFNTVHGIADWTRLRSWSGFTKRLEDNSADPEFKLSGRLGMLHLSRA